MRSLHLIDGKRTTGNEVHHANLDIYGERIKLIVSNVPPTPHRANARSTTNGDCCIILRVLANRL
jgi:hypothetical protein